MLKKRTALLAGAAVTAVVVVGTALVLWPEEERNARSGHAEPTSPDPMLKAPFPPLHAAEVEQYPTLVDPVSAAEEAPAALCDACLTEKAVLDVVETYLHHLDPVYLQGGLWAHPLSDVAPETPGMVAGLPKLPPGLLEAPEFNPFGMTVDTRSYSVETTWIVWFQTGWVPRHVIERRIRRVKTTPRGKTFSGDLPEVALSWPPIKEEAFVAVDSRTGEVRPDGLWGGIHGPSIPPRHRRALELARERADDWLRDTAAN